MWQCITKSSAVKTDEFWGRACVRVWVSACVILVNICCIQLLNQRQSLIFSVFPSLIFLCSLQMQSNLNFVFCLSNPPNPPSSPGPLTKKQESTMNRPKDEGILIANHFSPLLVLCSTFLILWGLCLYLCVIIY